MIDKIPLIKPVTPLLDSISEPAQLRELEEDQLETLAFELRQYLLYTVGRTGGHLGAGLGVIELTIALHYVFNTPEDRIVWDVGHQAYPHKILTGRRERMHSLRQRHGISGFPMRSESPFDTFGVGHSSTSISAALGMAYANELDGGNRQSIAVIGDGAMTAGMAFEALNHAAHTNTNMLVILNDNEMSISENVGGLSRYFSRIWASRTYNSLREGGKKVLENMPHALAVARRTEEHMKGMVSPGTLFEELGMNYIGPINGHDLERLVRYLRRLVDIPGPKLLHVVTQKGRGYSPAEQDPITYHALSKIQPKSEALATKIEPATQRITAANSKKSAPKYSQIFGDWLCDIAAADEKCLGITPAMREGSGMVKFSKLYPDRYHDVAIAEQHAVTFAAGLACENKKPVVAIYSTFLQRAYDQLIHDVALQNLDVTFGIDRAGLVGEDGGTHAGAFDLSYLRCIPNMIVMAPSDENECRQMLYTGYQYAGPAAIRYPRGAGVGVTVESSMRAFELGKGIIRRDGRKAKNDDKAAGKIAILAFGSLLHPALKAAEQLDATVADMRFVKPLDVELILDLADSHELLVTIEENVKAGGAGSAVNECLNDHNRLKHVLNLGLPDEFIEHGKPTELLAECGLDEAGIKRDVLAKMRSIGMPHTEAKSSPSAVKKSPLTEAAT